MIDLILQIIKLIDKQIKQLPRKIASSYMGIFMGAAIVWISYVIFLEYLM